jgi:hypothetical protein
MNAVNTSPNLPGDDSPDVADKVPELKQLLLKLDKERDRCLKNAANLSNWATFWTLSLVVVGAVVAAQGAFTKVWGNDNWISIAFVILGIFTSAGAGFQSAFKPAVRSPQFTESGLEYDRLARSLHRDAAALYRSQDPDTPAQNATFMNAMDVLLKNADEQLKAAQDKELSIYVTGPTMMWRAKKPSRRH